MMENKEGGAPNIKRILIMCIGLMLSGCNACDTEVYVVKGNALIVVGSDVGGLW